MEQIVYKPYLRKNQVILTLLAFALCLFSVFHQGRIQTYLIPLILLMVVELFDAITLCGTMIIDAQEIHAELPRRGEAAYIPWNAICKCKLYEGGYDDPAICVMFQNPSPIHFCKKLNTPGDVMPMNNYGVRVICDRDLQKMFLGLEKPE